ANFCSRSDRARAVDIRELSKPPPDSMVMAKCRARTDNTSRRPATENRSMHPPLKPGSKSRAIAQRFLRLSNLDPTLLDRVGSYEARRWRQAAQTIWTLEAMRQPPPPVRQRLRHRVAPFTWDRER